MMKHTLPLACCAFLLAGCVSTVNPNQSFVRVIAHRGYWAIASEKSSQNSIRALELADRLGIYGSEFDVHLTRDNVPVIYHDDKLLDTQIEIQKTN
jgi:glycerophosphoryl diester phosphodiesterase